MPQLSIELTRGTGDPLQDCRSTSYHANTQGKADQLIPHDQYLRLGLKDTERREVYRALPKAHIDDEIVGQIHR